MTTPADIRAFFEGKNIRVIAPASPIDPQALKDGVAYLTAMGAHVQVDLPEEPAAQPYLSASENARAAALQRALTEPNIDLILCTRGGYGCTPLLAHLDFDALINPPPLLGFSDITALQLALASYGYDNGIASVHLNHIEEHVSHEQTFDSLVSAVNGTAYEYIFKDAQLFHAQEAQGPVYAANLSLLCALLGTNYFPDLQDSILVIEEVGEELRKIDRMLVQLRDAGVFEDVQGVVFGQFTDCGAPEALKTFLSGFILNNIPCPTVTGLPFGHEKPTLCIAQGHPGEIRIKNNTASLIFNA